jgi:hypothetical protein
MTGTELSFFMRWEGTEIPDIPNENWVKFDGLVGLPKKRWYWPSWRWKWPQRVIEIMATSQSGVYVYFRTPERICMRTRWPVYTRAVSVRIGPGRVAFCALDAKNGLPVPIRILSPALITPI